MNDASGTRTHKSGGTARAQERHGDVQGERENPMVAALKRAGSRLEQRLSSGGARAGRIVTVADLLELMGPRS